MNKRNRIQSLLRHSDLDDHEIAERVNCTPSYVNFVRNGHSAREIERIVHTKMVLTDWHRDRHGNLSRELRGT